MRTTLLITILLLAMSIASSAAVPPMISYQGKLMQPSGAPVPDGTYSIQFAIYDDPASIELAHKLWGETNANVQVKGGLFSVLLGSVTPLPPSIFDGSDRWFGVKVGADPEMTPRQKIASVGFAVKAGSADIAASVPNGAITTGELADRAVTTAKMADSSVAASQIADGSVVGSKIDAGAITAEKIGDGAVTGTKIANSAILLGYHQVVDIQSPISSVTDLANLSATVAVPPGGRSVRITGSGHFDAASTGNKTTLCIFEEDTQLQEASIFNSSAVGGGSSQSLTCQAIVTPSPGTHTYRLRAWNSNWGALVADPSRPAFILVELL